MNYSNLQIKSNLLIREIRLHQVVQFSFRSNKRIRNEESFRHISNAFVKIRNELQPLDQLLRRLIAGIQEPPFPTSTIKRNEPKEATFQLFHRVDCVRDHGHRYKRNDRSRVARCDDNREYPVNA